MEPDYANQTETGNENQSDVSSFISSFLDYPLAHLPPSRIIEYEAGQLIYDFDQAAAGLYLVTDGRVTVRHGADNGRPVLVDIYQANEFFGESAFLRFSQDQEQAVALENTKVMIWSTAQIERIITLNPQLGVALLQILALRLSGFKSRLHSLASEPAPRRLVHTLIRFSERLGQKNEDGSIQIFPFTHSLLAQYVGTSREAITVFMNQFRRNGYLNYSRRGNIVIHRHALTEWLRKPSAMQPPAEQTSRAQPAAMAG